MAQTDIMDLFHELPTHDRSEWAALSSELTPEERDELMQLLESDLELQNNNRFLQPASFSDASTDIRESQMDATVSLADSSPTSDAKSALPDQIGDYRVLNVIAVHGQGAVYRADHTRLNRQVVIKVVKDQLNPAARQGLIDEGRALASLAHPNIAQIFDLTMHEGNPCLVMEYIEGRNLAELHSGSPMQPADAARLIQQIAIGMQHAHSNGVIHRDLKPANVVVRATDNEPKIIDFGLARARQAYAAGSDNSSYGGTVAYMPPEQARWVNAIGQKRSAEDPTDERSDVFAIGATLYAMLTGKKLYDAKTRQEGVEKAIRCDFDRDALRKTNAPKWLQDVCLKALAVEPADRYRSAEELAEALSAPKQFPVRWIVAAAILVGLGAWFIPQMLPERSAEIVLTANAPGDSTVQGGEEVVLRTTPIPDENESKGPTTIPVETPDVEFTHYHYPVGAESGINYPLLQSPGVFEEDDLDSHIEFNEPVFCYVFALNPDGGVQLCFPEQGADHLLSAPTSKINYPAEPGMTFGFTDGAGQQIFMVVWSREALPSFSEWSSKLGDLGSVAKDTSGRWIWNESDLEPWPEGTLRDRATRGGPRQSRALRGTESFVALCQSIEETGCGLYAITFPVRPPE